MKTVINRILNKKVLAYCLILLPLFFLTGCSNLITPEAIEKIAEGRVWTGATAKELGLVDELGGLDKALEIAAEKAGVDTYSIVNYPSKSGIFSSLLDEGKDDYINGKMVDALGESYHYIQLVENLKKMDRIQARMPFDLRIR